jgi:hypothetical protein
MFPLQTGGSRPGREADSTVDVLHLPFLVGVIELDGAGSANLQPAKRVKRHSLCPKAMGGAVRLKYDGVTVHGYYRVQVLDMALALH